MSDPLPIPVRRVFDVRPGKPAETADEVPAVRPSAPRKLVRPRLPVVGSPGRYVGRISSPPPLRKAPATPGGSSHAEAFYLQKQIQGQTPMIFVLEDGEQIEGTIEWYDLHVIKVKRGSLRTLIYKAGIKYLYKDTDGNGVGGRV